MTQQTEEQFEDELRRATAMSIESAKHENWTRESAKGQVFHGPTSHQSAARQIAATAEHGQQPDLISFDFQHVLGNRSKPSLLSKLSKDSTFEPISSSSLPSSKKSNFEYLEDIFQTSNVYLPSQQGVKGQPKDAIVVAPGVAFSDGGFNVLPSTSSTSVLNTKLSGEETRQNIPHNDIENSYSTRSNWIHFSEDPVSKSRSLPVSPDTKKRPKPVSSFITSGQVKTIGVNQASTKPTSIFVSYIAGSVDTSLTDPKQHTVVSSTEVGLGSQSFTSYLGGGSQCPTLTSNRGKHFSDLHQALQPVKQHSKRTPTSSLPKFDVSMRRINSQPDFQIYGNQSYQNGSLQQKTNILPKRPTNLAFSNTPVPTQITVTTPPHWIHGERNNTPDLMQFNRDLSMAVNDLSISDFDPLIAKKDTIKSVEPVEQPATEAESATVHQEKPLLPPRSTSIRAKSFHATDSDVHMLPPRPSTMYKESSLLGDLPMVRLWKPDSSVTFESSQKVQAEKVFFCDGLFDITEERDEEGESFCEGIMRLRRNYKFDDLQSNPGFVYSPVFQRRPVGGPEASIKLHLVMSMNQPITFTCDVNISVQHVISQALCYLAEPLASLPSECFMLKVQGAAEYLHLDAMLGDFEYVQNCRKLDRDVYLELLKVNDVRRDLSRTAEDDKQDVNIKRFSNLFDRPITTSVTKLGLSVLMDAFSMEVEKLRNSIKMNGKQHTSPVIQAANAICHTLASVEPSEISNAVNLMKTGAAVETSLENLTVGIFKLIDMYCKAFDTTFSAQTDNSCNGILSIKTMGKSLEFRLSAAHRVPVEWKSYDHFNVSCQIFYGGKALCDPVETWPAKVTTRFFRKIKWDQDITIPLAITKLPRESRLCLTLHGSQSDKADKVTLGWVAMPLFNYKRVKLNYPHSDKKVWSSIMLSGNNLLGLWPDCHSNPIGTCASNIMDPSSVIIHIEFPCSINNVIFPPIKTTLSNQVQGLSALPVDEEERISSILQKDVLSTLDESDAHFLWSKRHYCYAIPTALPRILEVTTSWDWAFLSDIYSMLASWKAMPPVEALHLLNPHFADQEVRTLAVSWIRSMSDDDLCDYLPQLVQALKYESYHDSALANFIIERSVTSVRITHYLYWYLRDGLADNQYRVRFQMVLGALMCTCGKALREQFHYQDALIKSLTLIADVVKSAKDTTRMAVLQSSLTDLSKSIAKELRLPTSPSLDVNGINIKACSYYPSFTVPIKLSFFNMDTLGGDIITIFKAGEDMRQDMLIMQMIRIMDKLWLSEGLDMRMITFICLATGKHQGMIEVVQDAETLRKIQVEHGVTGSFKDKPLAEWLQKHNPTELEYKKAVENFTFSCAGYCVATYVLGVGDRHNDNIMVTKTGHMFHIDFGKFLGNAQMFGNIKRDRVPFVLSSDMAYVINGGDKQSSKFQDFVDVCCAAFNLVRKHANLFFNMFGLMLNSGIAQLCRVEDLKYVQNALKPEASDAEATGMFTRLIEASLGSKSTQLNFFVHNLAQLRFSGVNPDELSFAPKKFSLASDGRITSASVFGIQKRYDSEKYYVYITRVKREGSSMPTFIFRRFSEFHELEHKLAMMNPEVKLQALSSRVLFGRTHVKQVAEKRKIEIDLFLDQLFAAPPTVLESDLVYTFFHPLMRDEKDATKTTKLKGDVEDDRHVVPGQIGGQVKLSVHYKNDALLIMVMHAKDLLSPDGTEPDPYVKTYLLPDSQKFTKRKTKIVKKSFNPTFNEMLVLNMPWNDILQRTLQLTVWNSDYLKENTFMGGVNIPLESLDLSQESVKWYSLSNLK